MLTILELVRDFEDIFPLFLDSRQFLVSQCQLSQCLKAIAK